MKGVKINVSQVKWKNSQLLKNILKRKNKNKKSGDSKYF